MTSLFNSANKNTSFSSSDNDSKEKSYVERQIVKSALQSLAQDLNKTDFGEKNHVAIIPPNPYLYLFENNRRPNRERSGDTSLDWRHYIIVFGVFR